MLIRSMVIGWLIRLAVVAMTFGPYLEPDRTQAAFGVEGGRIAWSIARGDGFGNPLDIPTGPSAWRSPVFPYLMAGFFLAFGLHSLTAAILMFALNCAFSALTAIPLCRIAQMTFGERVARWVAWAWAFFPYAIVNSTDQILDTPLSVLLIAILLLDTLRMRQATHLRDWVRHGALWALVALTHTGALMVLPFYWLWILFQMTPPVSRRVKLAGAGALVFCACVTPWLVRNYLVFDRFVPFRSNLAMELRVGNALVHTNRDERLHPVTNRAEARRMQQLGEIAYMEEKMAQFRQFVREHPGAFATRSIRRVFHYWFSIWEYRPAQLAAKPFETADIPFASFVTLTALIGLGQLWKRSRIEAMPYVIFLGLYPLLFYLSHRSYRYRHPVDPLLVLLGTAAMVAWWERRKGLTALRPLENSTESSDTGLPAAASNR